eukprot:6199598-Pleurochrysis_carterae.AAC.2
MKDKYWGGCKAYTQASAQVSARGCAWACVRREREHSKGTGSSRAMRNMQHGTRFGNAKAYARTCSARGYVDKRKGRPVCACMRSVGTV